MKGAAGAQGAGTQIQSVSRASALLMLASQHESGITATEAARLQNLALPTTYHLLNTLVDEGLLARDARRRYVLGPRVALLAGAYARTDNVPDYLTDPLRALATTTGETAYIAAWRRDEIHVLACFEGDCTVRVGEVERGIYDHPHARATGKLLLAFAPEDRRAATLVRQPLEPVTKHTIVDPRAFEAALATIREEGYAEDREEFLEGVSCVAAPATIDGVVIAALTVSAPSERFAHRRAELRHAVLAAAQEVADYSSPSIADPDDRG
jgi:IclR family transcriptional regulator, acetate operon repressor